MPMVVFYGAHGNFCVIFIDFSIELSGVEHGIRPRFLFIVNFPYYFYLVYDFENKYRPPRRSSTFSF